MFKFFLFLLSQIYLFFLLLDRKFTRRKKLPLKVISIGNLTLGGSGKTTLALVLAKVLKNKSKKVALLSRGYRSKIQNSKFKIQNSLIVSDGEKILLTPEEGGDEPYLLAAKLSGIPVIVGKERYKSGILAKEKFGSEVVILDDGFQHWPLERDLEIVCIDTFIPLEKEPLFPLGILREPVSALNRADLIFLNHVNLIGNQELTRWYAYLTKICPKVPIIEGIYQPVSLHLLNDNHKSSDVRSLKDKEIIAMSGIANPLSFEKSLEQLGAKIIKHYSFSDHYWYKIQDLEPIFSESVSKNYPIITTEKDAVKLRPITNYQLQITNRIYVLEIELEITKGEEIWEEKIKKVLS